MFDFACLIVFVSHLKAPQQQVAGIALLDLCADTLPQNDLHFFILFFLWNDALLSWQATHNTAFDCGMSVAF